MTDGGATDIEPIGRKTPGKAPSRAARKASRKAMRKAMRKAARNRPETPAPEARERPSLADALDGLRRAGADGAAELRDARQRRWSEKLALPETRWCDFDRPFRLADFYERAGPRRG